MSDEIQKLRADNEWLRADSERLRVLLARMNRAHKSACEDWGLLREENERLRAEVVRYKAEPALLRAELIALTNAGQKALAHAYDRARANAPDNVSETLEDGR